MSKIDRIGMVAIVIFIIGGVLGINMIFMWEDAIAGYDNCEYGSSIDIFGTRCITHSEMQKILECNDFYLRDGYWWECNDTEYNTNNYNPTFEGIVTMDGWDCPKINQYGIIQECITYWNSLSDLAENKGTYAMYKKLNNDGYLSDTVKQFIFEIEGIWLFDNDI